LDDGINVTSAGFSLFVCFSYLILRYSMHSFHPADELEWIVIVPLIDGPSEQDNLTSTGILYYVIDPNHKKVYLCERRLQSPKIGLFISKCCFLCL
jgi:hypothetical protein